MAIADQSRSFRQHQTILSILWLFWSKFEAGKGWFLILAFLFAEFDHIGFFRHWLLISINNQSWLEVQKDGHWGIDVMHIIYLLTSSKFHPDVSVRMVTKHLFFLHATRCCKLVGREMPIEPCCLLHPSSFWCMTVPHSRKQSDPIIHSGRQESYSVFLRNPYVTPWIPAQVCLYCVHQTGKVSHIAQRLRRRLSLQQMDSCILSKACCSETSDHLHRTWCCSRWTKWLIERFFLW